MIGAVTIAGFKRFTSQRFDLAPLTVLAGLNGTGKTSFIHALLLAREASSLIGETAVRLNGPFGLELGTAEAVRNWDAGGDIEVVVADDGGAAHRWTFRGPTDHALHLDVSATPASPPAAFSPKTRAFTYLGAERLGPRSVLGSSALPADSVEVGVRGEYSAQVIAALGQRPLAYVDRRHPETADSESMLLKYEVERWLSEVVRPTELEAEAFPGTAVTALRFRAPGGDWVRAPNMGFGVTYALPIVLGGLIAQPDGLLIVENPEAHLHPAGQSRMGFFLAWLSAHGVQVVVETHSDHVLNGVRRAIGEHRVLGASDAVVHYFDTAEGDKPRVTALHFTAVGGVSTWPSGFFDQYPIDVAALTRVRRKK